MKIAESEKCGLVSRLEVFLTCRFFPNGSRHGSRPRGTSIVIALGLIAAISAFTIGIASTMLIAIQNTASSKKALQAEYSAQGGVEMAKKELKGMGVAYGAGVTSPTSIYVKQICNDGKPATNGGCPNGVNKEMSSYFEYTVSGKDTVKVGGSYYTVPVGGTGSAGDDCKIGQDVGDVGHPCNWNKLYNGDSVEVPLYVVTNLDTGASTDFDGLGIFSFQIKVRTPCESGIPSASCSLRYSTDVNGQSPGKVVVNWQVSGTCGDESCGVSPTVYDGGADSFFSELDLSDGFASVDFWGDKGIDINDPSKIDLISNLLINLDKPVLKLSFVNEITDGDVSIPYLEYQILYRGGPLAASYTVSINGFAEGFLYSLSGVQSSGAGLFDFAVQN